MGERGSSYLVEEAKDHARDKGEEKGERGLAPPIRGPRPRVVLPHEGEEDWRAKSHDHGARDGGGLENLYGCMGWYRCGAVRWARAGVGGQSWPAPRPPR